MKVFLLSILLCLTVFTLYLTGATSTFLIWSSSKIKYEWNISQTCVAYFYNPLWACLECPPFLIVDISPDRECYKGKTIRVFQDGNDLGKYGPSAEAGSFFVCEGNIKKSFSLLVWEFVEFRFDTNSDEPVNGQFFDAKNCKYIRPTLFQEKYIEKMLHFYGE